jgi:hypothetical protein
MYTQGQKISKSTNIKVFRSNKTKGPKQDRTDQLRSPMSESGELRSPMSESGELRSPMSESGELRSPMSESGEP